MAARRRTGGELNLLGRHSVARIVEVLRAISSAQLSSAQLSSARLGLARLRTAVTCRRNRCARARRCARSPLLCAGHVGGEG